MPVTVGARDHGRGGVHREPRGAEHSVFGDLYGGMWVSATCFPSALAFTLPLLGLCPLTDQIVSPFG